MEKKFTVCRKCEYECKGVAYVSDVQEIKVKFEA